MSSLKKRARVEIDGEDDDDLLGLAKALDNDVFDDERQEPVKANAKTKLTEGSVTRLMRNLMVSESPIVVCLLADGNNVRLWDGQRAVDAQSSVALTPGGVYRLDKYSNDRREGKRELRVFAVTHRGELDKRFFPISVIMHDQSVSEENQPPAFRTAVQLAESTGQPLRVAFHALYVMNGSPSAAFEYLSDASVNGWTPQEDEAVRLEDVLERRLHEALTGRDADEQDARALFLKSQ